MLGKFYLELQKMWKFSWKVFAHSGNRTSKSADNSFHFGNHYIKQTNLLQRQMCQKTILTTQHATQFVLKIGCVIPLQIHRWTFCSDVTNSYVRLQIPYLILRFFGFWRPWTDMLFWKLVAFFNTDSSFVARQKDGHLNFELLM